MNGAFRWLHVGTDTPTCPECGGDLEHTHVRMPALQEHFRGVPALSCEGCEYAELDE